MENNTEQQNHRMVWACPYLTMTQSRTTMFFIYTSHGTGKPVPYGYFEASLFPMVN
jgi:hypothetical protein